MKKKKRFKKNEFFGPPEMVGNHAILPPLIRVTKPLVNRDNEQELIEYDLYTGNPSIVMASDTPEGLSALIKKIGLVKVRRR